jgi:3-oxoacyl-[acyl-carrier-protein] synthase II
MIARGACDVMVAGGTEAGNDYITMAGLSRPMSLSTKYNDAPLAASRPFDAGRDGFVISEGAGILVLEELEHATARSAQIHAEILGYGMSGDAYHVTKPSGTGAVKAMQSALTDAGLPPDAVGHVNAHATSTTIGDASENRAVKEVFAEHAHKLLVSAPKSSVGHMLGACGSVEAIFTALAVREGLAPPTINLTSLEPEFDLNYVPNTAVEWASDGNFRVAISNSFGFGGTNASLCIGQFIQQ